MSFELKFHVVQTVNNLLVDNLLYLVDYMPFTSLLDLTVVLVCYRDREHPTANSQSLCSEIIFKKLNIHRG